MLFILNSRLSEITNTLPQKKSTGLVAKTTTKTVNRIEPNGCAWRQIVSLEMFYSVHWSFLVLSSNKEKQ